MVAEWCLVPVVQSKIEAGLTAHSVDCEALCVANFGTPKERKQIMTTPITEDTINGIVSRILPTVTPLTSFETALTAVRAEMPTLTRREGVAVAHLVTEKIAEEWFSGVVSV